MFNYRDSEDSLRAKLDLMVELELQHEDDRRWWFVGVLAIGAAISVLVWNPNGLSPSGVMWTAGTLALAGYSLLVIAAWAWHQLRRLRRYMVLVQKELELRRESDE